MLAYAFDHDEPKIWLPYEEPFPEHLRAAFLNPDILKIAWYSEFEHEITFYKLNIDIPWSQMRDPIILARNISLPGKLEQVGEILKMEQRKDERGKELIKMFSMPAHMGGENTLFGISEPLFRDHTSHPQAWAEWVEYCKQDVRAERDIWYRLAQIPFPQRQWEGWFFNQKMNAFGMPGRRDLAEKGIRVSERYVSGQYKILSDMTQLKNPNSDHQMKAWARARGYPWNSLNAKYVTTELDNPNSPITPECRAALQARKAFRKSSYKKLEKFLALLGPDDRLRWQFSYMGAARTGRWKSGGKESETDSMQTQNMSRGMEAVSKELPLALELLDKEDYDGMMKHFYDDQPDPKKRATPVEVVITLLRSLFQAKAGKKLIVADKGSIETRILGWIAGEEKINDDIFRHKPEDGGDPYIAFAVYLFSQPYAELWHEYKVLKNKEKRQLAKPPMLGCGYQLAGGEEYTNSDGDVVRGGAWGYALYVCGVDMPKELAHKAVNIYRNTYKRVVQLWEDLEQAFKQVLRRGGEIRVGEVTWDRLQQEWVEHPTKGQGCVLTFRRHAIREGGYAVSIELPSGRRLHYWNATIEAETKQSKKTGREYTVEVIKYDGVEHSATYEDDGRRAKAKAVWGRVKGYGGKFCLVGSTSVITNRGIVPLDQVQLNDLVWDGEQWINHGGLVYNGVQEVSTWMGLTGTPDHQILAGNEWRELEKTTNRSGLCSLLTGLASGIRLWCSLNQENAGVPACVATADKSLMSIRGRYGETTLTTAHRAERKKVGNVEQNVWGTTSFSTPSFENHGSGSYPISCLDATTQNAEPTRAMEVEESSVMNLGDKTDDYFLNTRLPSQVGMIRVLNLIEKTTMETMNLEISGWSLVQSIQTIADQLSGLIGTASAGRTKFFADDILRCGVRTLSTITSSADAAWNGVFADTEKQKVYDLLDCGPNHRFTVMTEAGPVIVHNCENVVQAISRDDLLESLLLGDEMGFDFWGVFHDEGGAENDDDEFGLNLDNLIWCFTQPAKWAPGLLLGAEGFEGAVYRKG